MNALDLLPANGNGKIIIFTNEELIQFFKWFNINWRKPEWRSKAFYVALIFCTGLRRFEAAALLTEDCHEQPEATVEVRHGKRNRYRCSDVLPQFQNHFRAFIQEARQDRRTALFPSPWSKRAHMSTRLANDWWREIIEAAGLEYYQDDIPRACHVGRHSFITYAPRVVFIDKEGKPFKMKLADLREQVGHSDLKTTMKHYYASLPGTRFGQKKITWPDYVAGPGADQVAEEALPDDPEILKAMIRQYRKRGGRGVI